MFNTCLEGLERLLYQRLQHVIRDKMGHHKGQNGTSLRRIVDL